MEVDIKQIKVTQRFRKSFEDIEELAASIARYGLIEPIILDEDNNLIAGERRLRAHLMLKKETIDAKYMKDLDELQKKEVELEENIQRSDFTWQEEVAAKAELHKMKQRIHGARVPGKETEGTWGIVDTAKALDESITVVSQDIQLAEGIRAFPELANEKTKSTAFKKYKALKEKLLQEELVKRMKDRGLIENPNVYNGSCIDVMAAMEPESIDLIIADPPFGIDLDESNMFGDKNPQRVYHDDEHEIYDMLDKAIANMYRVLKHDRHCYIFFAIQHYERLKSLIEKHGFEVCHVPLIWDKMQGSFPSQSINYVVSYEPFFFCKKGSRKLNGTPRDVFSIKKVPPQKKIHPAEKPTEFLRDLINLSSLPGERVLDPFAGSGSTLVAAKELNRIGIGIELDPVFHKGIVDRLQAAEIK